LNFVLIVCRCRHEGGGAHRDCVKLWWDDQTKYIEIRVRWKTRQRYSTRIPRGTTTVSGGPRPS